MPAYGYNTGSPFGPTGIVRRGAYDANGLGSFGQPAQGPSPPTNGQFLGGGGYGPSGMLNKGGQYSVIGPGGFYDPNAEMGAAQNSALGAPLPFVSGAGGLAGTGAAADPAAGMGAGGGRGGLNQSSRPPWWLGGGMPTSNMAGIDPRVAAAMQVRQQSQSTNFLRR